MLDHIRIDRCPICDLVKIRMDELFWWFEKESYHDASALNLIYSDPYICPSHRARLLKMGSLLSTTFEFMLTRDLETFEHLKALKPLAFKRNTAKLIKSRCRFCIQQEEIEARLVNEFVMLIKQDSEARDLFEKKGYLCRKHLLMSLSVAGKKDGEIFLRKGAEIAEKLLAMLDEFFKREDYRFQHLSRGVEQRAWLDALRFYSGDVEG